jgi:hypothetical protein
MMTKKIVNTFVCVVIATISLAQTTARPDVPQSLKPADNEKLSLVAHASGVQVYTCQQGSDGKYAWTLKGPEAELRDDRGLVIGRHYEGPTWQHLDESSVVGKVAARVDSPDPNSVPWLLLNAAKHSGHGVFSTVTSIQRVHTRGGQPPATDHCNASTEGNQVQSKYTADYYFYTPM